ncbi:MAG TPA: hypothetical protein VJJ76_01180 [archaeon]|nr:hypothetical protein [archaeon]
MTSKTSKKSVDYFRKRYEESKDFQEIFSLIKEGIEQLTGRSRTGLMLGMADLGVRQNGFIGAFYPVGSNIIVLNKTPLNMIEAQKPDMLKSYVFHVLMHEYLHTLGILNERHTDLFVFKINEKLFGENHEVTRMSFNFDKLFPSVIMPAMGWQPQNQFRIELVEDFERTSYIG